MKIEAATGGYAKLAGVRALTIPRKSGAEIGLIPPSVGVVSVVKELSSGSGSESMLENAGPGSSKREPMTAGSQGR